MVLMYHRVGAPELDPWRLSVSPEHFAQHMALLRRSYQPMPLRELVRAPRHNRIPPGAIAVTFDDGYADVLEQATPVLQRFEIPATAFIVSGYVGAQKGYW